jgi:hypothetical protein
MQIFCLSHAVFLHASTNSTPPAAIPHAPTPQSLSKPLSIDQCSVMGAYARFETTSFHHTHSRTFSSRVDVADKGVRYVAHAHVYKPTLPHSLTKIR